MHRTWSLPSIVGHFLCNGTPRACSMMIYSLPMTFEASSLQSRMFGIGMLVLACTRKMHSGQPPSHVVVLIPFVHNVRYLIVATSELVVNFGGPANAKGNLATMR